MIPVLGLKKEKISTQVIRRNNGEGDLNRERNGKSEQKVGENVLTLRVFEKKHRSVLFYKLHLSTLYLVSTYYLSTIYQPTFTYYVHFHIKELLYTVNNIPLRSHKMSNKTFNAKHGIPSLECLSEMYQRPPKIMQVLATACPAEPYSETLLLKTPHSFFTGYGEIKL